MVRLSGSYPPTPTGDDRPAMTLLAALATLARKDAERGDRKVAAFLADLAQHRPRGWRFGEAEQPAQLATAAD